MPVSIIIPAYNEEKYIERTLQSLQGSGAEIIVVCNGCTDKTEEVAKRYANKVIVVKEKGVSHARNAGAMAATHDRLVFLDADILVDPDLMEKISVSPHTIGTCLVQPDSGNFVDKIHYAVKSQIHRLGTCTGLLFCDKLIFDRAGGFEEDLFTKEDGRFLRRAMKQGNFGVVNGYCYNNMRRFRQKGYVSIAWFWIKEYLSPSHGEYESVR